jgi:hypothetical protein
LDSQRASGTSGPITEEYLREQRELADARERAYQDRLRQLLGEQKRLQLADYMHSMGTRSQVNRLRAELAAIDALRDDQIEPLIAAIHAERSQMETDVSEFRDKLNAAGGSPASMQKYGDFQVKQLKATNVRIRTAAAAILSQAQLKELDAMLQRDLARQETLQKMSRIQSKIERPANGPDSSN